MAISYLVAVFFIVIILFFSHLFFNGIVPKLSFPYFPNAGLLYTPWVISFAITVLIAHLTLFQAMCASSGIYRKQRRFFLIANLLGYTGGIGCFLPVYNLPYFPFPYGPYGVFLLSLVSGYTILKHRLIDLQFLLKNTIVFAFLFGTIISIFSFVVFIFQNILYEYVNENPFLSTAVSVFIIILVYEPLRLFLVRVTDKYLFQKKEEIRLILNRLSQNIITILDLEEVGKTMLGTLENSLRLEAGAILVKDENGEEYPILGAFGFKSEDLTFNKTSPLIQFFEMHDPILNLENEEEKRGLPESVREPLERMGTHICMPLFVHNELIGILTLGKKKSDEDYKPEETDYFPTLAGQAAIALSNARLYDILKKSEIDFAQQAKMAAIGTLSAGIGHEIKNPLAAIKSGVEMLRLNKKFGVYKDLDKEQYQAIVDDVIERILRNVDRAAGVIDRLSSFAKKPKEIKIEAVDLQECASSALALLQQELEHYNIIVTKEFPSGFPRALADKTQMEDIFLNLFVNARHAIKEKGQIKIVGALRNGEVEVAVKDTGAGIAKEHLEKIFDPFFTTKDVSRNPDPNAIKGTGLGLFLVREFIKKFGGHITVESELGRGTTFRLYLRPA